MIKIVVFDIDGVLTNGTYIIDNKGNESKIVSYKDLDSFNLIKSIDIKTMFLTGEKSKLSDYFNKKFRPDIFYDGVDNKFDTLNKYLKENNIDLSEVCYVGDGKKDIECIDMCGLSICPSNSIEEVKDKSNIVLSICGGNGVVYEVYKILKNRLIDYSIDYNMEVDHDFDKILDIHFKIINDIKNNDEIKINIDKSVKIILTALKKDKIIFACGNGGSASDSQHFVAELVSKFKKDRRSLPALALTTNTSILTSIGNDYSFDKIFSRQIEGLGKKDDVLFAISTSGTSINVDNAINEARRKQMKIILLTSEKCPMKNVDAIIKIPSKETDRIQEFHIMIIHYLCQLIEKEYISYEK